MKSSLNIQKIVKPSFAVIGIEGSTDDGEGFIPMLWSDANAHFDEVSPVASRDENGALLGIMALVFLGAYIALFKGYAVGHAFLISGCVGISLLVAIVISSLVGTLVPILFHKVKVDPAVASGPLITTVNDLVAVTAYYGLAWLLLIEILHF